MRLPPLPGSLGYCVWIKVLRGGSVSASVDLAVSEGNHSNTWQPIIVNAPRANSTSATFGVTPFASFDNSLQGDVEFDFQTATLMPRPLTSCPRWTLDNLATGRSLSNVPPQYPVIEHPQWTGPAPQAAAPYSQGPIAPAYVPGPNTLPQFPSNKPAPAAPSNAPGGKK